jgi:hypothetical protein
VREGDRARQALIMRPQETRCHFEGRGGRLQFGRLEFSRTGPWASCLVDGLQNAVKRPVSDAEAGADDLHHRGRDRGQARLLPGRVKDADSGVPPGAVRAGQGMILGFDQHA